MSSSEDHGVRIVQMNSQGTPMLVQCLCGDIASLDSNWTIVNDHGDGTVTLTPSIDYKDHFHTEGTFRVTVGDVDLSLRKNE
jgi:hypothetical protein